MSGIKMRLNDCHNFHDFRTLAQRRLPGPIFNYIDGAADDEKTHRQNTASFDRCDLIPTRRRDRRHLSDSHGPETRHAVLLLAHGFAALVPP
jgi:L-lactate dehydrogenase (cytochrome)